MDKKVVLALDVSTKTGWSVGLSSSEGYKLLEHGAIPKVSCPPGKYPENFLKWAKECFAPIHELLKSHAPDVVVIEETASLSKNAHDQKILEFIHFMVATMLAETGIDRRYFMTEEWRRICGCVMNDAEKLQGKIVRNAKKRARSSGQEGVVVVKNEAGKRIGRVTRKHINVRRANEVFGLNLKIKNEDIADSLLLGYAWHTLRRRKEQT